MPKSYLNMNVFEAALLRIEDLYNGGHTIVVSFSGGKDSGVCLELCVMVAKRMGKLPVNVVMRDEEIMFPGTFEYAERISKRPEINFKWLYACQPVLNIYNRKLPYYWAFDPLLKPEQWVRQPPARAYKINTNNINTIISEERFPVKEGGKLIGVTGVTARESMRRLMSIQHGYLSQGKTGNAYLAKPIYDWNSEDVFKAIKDNKWDYNSAYSVMARHGMPLHKLRIAPPFMSPSGVEGLRVCQRAFPTWWNKVCQRVEGARQGAYYGRRAILPQRKLGETWQQCFYRTCVDEAPEWIRERSLRAIKEVLSFHAGHSVDPFPEKTRCPQCPAKAWYYMTNLLYGGDPFCMRGNFRLPYIEPEFFRKGSGYWGGKPAW